MPCTLCTILKTCNPPEGAKLNFFEKWAVITRACVFSMTLTSALVGVLLALNDGHFAWTPALLATLGLVLAHAANNVLNDLMDHKSGVDTPDYYRAQYSPHPILAGWTTARGLLVSFLIFSLADLAILAYFVMTVGWGAAVFAGLGFFISLFYVGGKFSLKFLGLGEAAVLLVWGPLMVGGTYFVLAGRVPLAVLLASLPYALLVTTVILGKHVDKYEKDKEKKIKTLPVLLGQKPALTLAKIMIVGFYVLVVAESVLNIIPLASLLALASLGRAHEVWGKLSAPRPETKPEGWAVWPLWFVGWCFHLGKLAGGLLIAGMAGQILLVKFIQHYYIK
jgi:1,4-dihydroxy-2-naphthoate polyprenyltransferase